MRAAEEQSLEEAILSSRILIVDDVLTTVRLVERSLRNAGYDHLFSTTDPHEVLGLFEAHKPDLILLDLHMPDLDGFGVMEQLRSKISAEEYLPILVLTMDSSDELRRRALAAGARDFLTAAGHSMDLLLRIRNLLETRQLHLRLRRQNSSLEEIVRARTSELEETLRMLSDAQDQMREESRSDAFKEMSHGLVHDFNNVLGPIVGYADLLQRDSEMPRNGRVQEWLRIIQLAADDAVGIINRLRSFYRPRYESDAHHPIDIAQVIRDSLSLAEPKWGSAAQAQGAEIVVETRIEPVPAILGDAPQLREALVNLILNAVDAMPEGGTLVVGCDADDNQAWIEVLDNGIGMSCDVRNRCLQPFFTTKASGSGLGMGMVQGIAERHEGRLEIESELGKGTCMRLVLPLLSERPTKLLRPQHLTPRGTRRLQVLVVDDDATIRRLWEDYLIVDGHSCTPASDGEEALSLLKQRNFDVLLTDFAMPKMNGEQLVQVTRQLKPDMPIIMLSGFVDGEPAHKPEGVDELIPKPVGLQTLRRVLSRYL